MSVYDLGSYDLRSVYDRDKNFAFGVHNPMHSEASLKPG